MVSQSIRTTMLIIIASVVLLIQSALVVVVAKTGYDDGLEDKYRELLLIAETCCQYLKYSVVREIVM